MLPPHPTDLPAASAEAQAVSDALTREISRAISESGGWISFARFMELALYAPGLGYYSAGSTKLGSSGDFITAPELSPLFGRCLARQVADVLERGLGDVLEIGAGSGALAGDLLVSLERAGRVPRRFFILEVSADLRERQRERIAGAAPHLLDRVAWLDRMPAAFEGVIIGNEVLDALPANLVRVREGRIEEIGVAASPEGFVRENRAAQGELLRAAAALDLPDGYETEINVPARAFIASVAAALKRGAVILIDYGFPAAEYYHPQRSSGTLMCHYRHRSHTDPFAFVGLQDITAHVDFTSIADAAVDAGLNVLGYTSQAQFLINCGITDLLAEISPDDTRAYAKRASEAQKLLSPAEMGELFKVIAFGRGIEAPPLGFARGDRTHTL